MAARIGGRRFSRVSLKETGETPARAVERLRPEAARPRAGDGREPIRLVARDVGSGDAERMRRSFLRLLGQSPQSLRRTARAHSRPSTRRRGSRFRGLCPRRGKGPASSTTSAQREKARPSAAARAGPQPPSKRQEHARQAKRPRRERRQPPPRRARRRPPRSGKGAPGMRWPAPNPRGRRNGDQQPGRRTRHPRRTASGLSRTRCAGRQARNGPGPSRAW